MTRETFNDAPRRLLVAEEVSLDTFGLRDAQLLLDGMFGNRPRRAQYKEAVGLLGQRPVLASIVDSILVDSELLQEVGDRSFLHSNGMERINLLATREYDLRFHVWRPGKRTGVTEDPHDHLYDFASVVVAGELAKDVFIQSTEGLIMDAFAITTQRAQLQPLVTQAEAVHLLPVSPRDGFIIADHAPPYSMGHAAIHRLRPNPEETVVTLNLRGPGVKDTSEFFAPPNADHPTPTTSPLDIVESLTRVRDILG